MRSGRMIIHDFVVMPNHVHILMTVPGDMTLEKAMQLIKGGFSFRPVRNWDFEARSGSAGIPMYVSSMNGALRSIGRT